VTSHSGTEISAADVTQDVLDDSRNIRATAALALADAEFDSPERRDG